MKISTKMERTFIPVTLLMVSLTASQAHAASCPGSVNLGSGGVYNLTADLVATTSAQTCLSVTGTGTVDLNGFTISAPTGTGIAAIDCVNTGITIRDSRSPTTNAKGNIYGSWTYGIKNCGTIDGVRIESPSLGQEWSNYGVYNDNSHTLVSLKNSILGLTNTGVSASWLGSGGIVHNSITSFNFGISVIQATGGNPIPIAGNSVFAFTAGLYAGFYLNISIYDNLFTGLDGTTSNAWCIQQAAPSTIGVNWGSCTGSYCNCSDVLDEADAPTGFDRPWIVPADCPGVIDGGGTVELTDDYDLASTSGTCIQINDPYTVLDLKGHVIMNSAMGGKAISCANSSTTIIDSTKSGGIRGGFSVGTLGFATGVENCNGLSYVRMQDVTTGVSNSSTYGLHSIDHSMIDAEGTAVSSYIDARTGSITNSRFRSAAAGIYISGVGSGTGKVDVSNNAIRESPTYAVKSATSAINLHDNLMYRGAAVANPPTSTCLDLPSGTTSTNLMCECPSETRCESGNPVIAYPF